MRPGEARTPDGLRLYAIGDVHGCDDLLAEVHGQIAADIAARPVADYRIVHLGDFVDRGPDSATVIERLTRLCAGDERVLCLRGNHEEMLLDFLADPIANGPVWLMNGADMTLLSYGIGPADMPDPLRQVEDLAERFAQALPPHHRAFLNALPYSVRFGDYFFCHAGARPCVPFEKQDTFDLVWIRDGFLESRADFGAVVVHGHTPTPEPEVLPNRINIDTGAVFSGRLTCLALEGNRYRFL